jgi:hypothetical protein
MFGSVSTSLTSAIRDELSFMSPSASVVAGEAMYKYDTEDV